MGKKTLAEATKEIFDNSVKNGYRDKPQAIHDPNEDDTGEAIVHPMDKGKVYDKDIKKDKSAPVKNADVGDLNNKPKLTKVSEEDEDFEIEDLFDEDGEINEDVLNEISADTLKRYIMKNKDSQKTLATKMVKTKMGAGRRSLEKQNKIDALNNKIVNRDIGLSRAVSRMGKKAGPKSIREEFEMMEDDALENLIYDEDGNLDEEMLNEISTERLRRYVRNNIHNQSELEGEKASKFKYRGAGRPTKGESKKRAEYSRISANRETGLERALSRMGKLAGRRPNYEDMEIDELDSYLYDENGEINEEVLNELSADTLKRYTAAAASNWVSTEKKLASARASKAPKKEISALAKKAVNRHFGISDALKRFGKKSGPKAVSEAYEENEVDKVSVDGENVDSKGENVEGTKKLSAKGSKAQIIINIGENISLKKEEIDPLFENNEDISEEFKEKVRSIFEVAVGQRVAEIAEELVSEANDLFDEEIATVETEISESVEDFLKLVAREWLIENQVALEQNLKSEIIEDFIDGLKNLFEEHYIEIPENKLDIVEELSSKNVELEESLNGEINEKIENYKYIKELEAKIAFNDIIKEHSLSVAQEDKIAKLAENIEFDNISEFEKKLVHIIGTYAMNEETKKTANKRSSMISEELITDESKNEVIVVDNDVKAIMSALQKSRNPK